MAIATQVTTVLEIQKMPDGGYIVGDGFRRDSWAYSQSRFASTSIEEALKYVKSQLDPKPRAAV